MRGHWDVKATLGCVRLLSAYEYDTGGGVSFRRVSLVRAVASRDDVGNWSMESMAGIPT